MVAATAEAITLHFWDPNSLPYVIDWAAWATLAVGIAAVIGAYRIGIKQVGIAVRQIDIADRQAKITDKQTNIAAQQAETEQIRLRAELYDRRVAVYTGIERYLVDVSSNNGKSSPEIRQELYSSISVSSFILDEDVANIGRRILQLGSSLLLYTDRLRAAELGTSTNQLVEKIDAINDELASMHTVLRSHMGRYLKLGLSAEREALEDDEAVDMVGPAMA